MTIYHILFPSHFSKSFITFIRQNKQVLTSNHKFIFINQVDDTFDTLDSRYLKTFKLIQLFCTAYSSDRFVLHGFFSPNLLLATFFGFFNLNKVVWIVWGGDLHYKNKKKNIFQYRISLFIRTFVIRKMAYIATFLEDYKLAVTYYGATAQFIPYPVYPLKYPYLTHSINTTIKTKKILIGNSADSTNRHSEILTLLEPFKNELIQVITPLSYGGNPSYINNIIVLGKQFFGSKFVALTQYMPIKEYNELLSTIDIMICNHERQQALGNIYALLSLGKKVFIRRDISTAQMFNEIGIRYFDTTEISTMSFEEFSYMEDDVRQKNIEIISQYISFENILESWNRIFRTISPLS